MGCLQARTLPAHHQQQHTATGERFGEMADPQSQLGPSIDHAEVIQHVVSLRADRLPFAGDHITLAHFDCGNSLLRDQFLDQPLAAQGIGLQIAGALKCGRQQLAAQAPRCRRLGGLKPLELK